MNNKTPEITSPFLKEGDLDIWFKLNPEGFPCLKPDLTIEEQAFLDNDLFMKIWNRI